MRRKSDGSMRTFSAELAKRYSTPLLDKHLQYAYDLGARNVVAVADCNFSEIASRDSSSERDYVMELSADEIRKMAEQGGYVF